jgi:hypothetical protein
MDDFLSFYLPRTIWRVTKKYITIGVSREDARIINQMSKEYFFYFEHNAKELFNILNIESEEFVELEDGGYTLPVIVTLEDLNTVDLIPKVLDI